MLFWIIGIYLLLGIISTIACIVKKPLILYAGWGLIILVPFAILTFPYWFCVIVLFPDNTGRWI